MDGDFARWLIDWAIDSAFHVSITIAADCFVRGIIRSNNENRRRVRAFLLEWSPRNTCPNVAMQHRPLMERFNSILYSPEVMAIFRSVFIETTEVLIEYFVVFLYVNVIKPNLPRAPRRRHAQPQVRGVPPRVPPRVPTPPPTPPQPPLPTPPPSPRNEPIVLDELDIATTQAIAIHLRVDELVDNNVI
ncbi:uncharacterized protein SPSK_00182 [Sporothrix schenckii 1099-18]|uniref:Uncharacterized protein n=1 Tax=Sporothrix schenckii 1099-18 TaxID=1397361 RepID=A0A0F2M681_SPOSC|nr:uncharacterized protein SPSK_00182 [Sporothrix schenckii 1099-18]KJR83691.1 hypothetical protein SPSK_00182 [Sporothrix schenckii 1099-18]